ncbi:hypothetical protein MFRU_007g03090 [Monilinia fructicola]|nr:hypothetical protein MFRU_007g03090 [Monilinia fructicola]
MRRSRGDLDGLEQMDGIDFPEDVSTGSKFDRDGNAVTGIHSVNIKMSQDDFKADSWVRKITESMPIPRFRPSIIFRYHKAKCYSLGRSKSPKCGVELSPVLMTAAT